MTKLLVVLSLWLTSVSCGGGTSPEAGCQDEAGNPLPVAPADARVDLGEPTFSHPLEVTNPLFPVGQLDRAILLGAVDGVPLRVETTLLPYTRTIEWNGRRIETLVSQYVAFLDRRIHEVALDWYAQDDDGAVWYFGEDVFNYEDGVVANTDGTWLAGREGPAGMIMPGNPRVGDVWRPENACGVVFEEVTAESTGVAVTGPLGSVSGALVVDELHVDGSHEGKTFAPGYGEFSTGAGGDLEAVALAVPTDAGSSTMPAELTTLLDGAAEVFDAAQVGDWGGAGSTAAAMNGAWDRYGAGTVPPRLATQMDAALAALDAAVATQRTDATRQAAVAVGLATLDLQLRHRPRAEVDLALLDLWARQLQVDAEADDEGATLGDAATLRWIRDRLAEDVVPSDRIGLTLRALLAAAEARDLTAASGAATRLRLVLESSRAAPGRSPRQGRIAN